LFALAIGLIAKLGGSATSDPWTEAQTVKPTQLATDLQQE
jgi:hypothetical protein